MSEAAAMGDTDAHQPPSQPFQQWTSQVVMDQASYTRIRDSVFGTAKPKLVALDDWMLGTLPALVAARSPPYLTKPELSQLMTWKLTKGTYGTPVATLVRSSPTRNVNTVAVNWTSCR